MTLGGEELFDFCGALRRRCIDSQRDVCFWSDTRSCVGGDVQWLCFSERNRPVPNVLSYKVIEACREPGCPICRLEQQGVERYLDHQFYENVNSPAWRERLRASHGFCYEHAWLGVNRRLGDALGFSIIYHDMIRSLFNSLEKDTGSRRGQKALRRRVETVLAALKAKKRSPACERRDELTRSLLSALVEEIRTPEMMDALKASEGLCLPHFRLALGFVNDDQAFETMVALCRTKLENLQNELGEFIRKNDYQAIQEGFGSEGNAWLRAIGMVVGNQKER